MVLLEKIETKKGGKMGLISKIGKLSNFHHFKPQMDSKLVQNLALGSTNLGLPNHVKKSPSNRKIMKTHFHNNLVKTKIKPHGHVPQSLYRSPIVFDVKRNVQNHPK